MESSDRVDARSLIDLRRLLSAFEYSVGDTRAAQSARRATLGPDVTDDRTLSDHLNGLRILRRESIGRSLLIFTIICITSAAD